MNAPWRWHWARVLGFLAQCGAWYLALQWSPFFGIPLSLWVAIQIRAGYTEPLPSPTAAPPLSPPTSYVSRKRYNDAQTTYDPPVTHSHIDV